MYVAGSQGVARHGQHGREDGRRTVGGRLKGWTAAGRKRGQRDGRMVWNKDCVAESVEKLKRTYMDRIRNVMASVVLMCAAGAFMSAFAQ